MTPPRRKGWIVIDVIAGILLLAAVATLLTVSLSRTARARDRLAAERAAADRLEQALVDLSMARPVDASVRVRALASTRPTTQAMSQATTQAATTQAASQTEPLAGTGLRWVELSTDIVPGRPLTLIGTAPAEGALP